MSSLWSVTNAAVNTGYGIPPGLFDNPSNRYNRIMPRRPGGAYAGRPLMNYFGGDISFEAFSGLGPELEAAMQDLVNYVAQQTGESITDLLRSPDRLLQYAKDFLPKAYYKIKGWFKRLLGKEDKQKKAIDPAMQRKLAAILRAEIGDAPGRIKRDKDFENMSLGEMAALMKQRKENHVTPKKLGDKIRDAGTSLYQMKVMLDKTRSRTSELEGYKNKLNMMVENGDLTKEEAKAAYRAAMLGADSKIPRRGTASTETGGKKKKKKKKTVASELYY